MKAAVAAVVAAAALLGSAVPAHAQARPETVEGCHYSASVAAWIYPDGSLCRGTGEDPTTDANGSPACADGLIAVPQQRFGTMTFRCADPVFT